MKNVKSPVSQEVIAVTGKLVAASRKELAKNVSQLGHRMIAPEKTGITILVAAGQPNADHIAIAKSIDATILTERQFIEWLGVPGLIESISQQACDPKTSKRRLTQLAAVVPDAVAQNPIWQILHLANPNFLAKEDLLLKMRLLKLAPEALLHHFVLATSGSMLGVDVYADNGVIYNTSDDTRGSAAMRLGEYTIAFHSSECDAEMEDCGPGCDERLSIGQGMRAYLLSPFEYLQKIASDYGIEYEHVMSPCNGSPFRISDIELTDGEWGLDSYDLDTFPDDASLIARLVKVGEGLYRGVTLNEVDCKRPLFGCPPSVDQDSDNEGIITVGWSCDCFIPLTGEGGDRVVWSKVNIDEQCELTGAGLYDFEIDYEYRFPIELERQLVEDIKGNSRVDASLNACLLSILGLK